MASMKVACVVLMCMVVVGAPIAQASISCGQVASALSPCLEYLRKGGNPSAECCKGVKGLVAAAQTTADKQAACKCLKSAAGTIGSLNNGNAQALPAKCGVSLPYKISTSTNCDTIKF
ncbi:hypothetical protein RIF29_15472 [Crotalaria pallida]|uniref:Non-specific lipid-transfer protein n=1 Tax=Crotalaria pallida TaxID=3830 RepID=A0AAN9ICM3_CROPI